MSAAPKFTPERIRNAVATGCGELAATADAISVEPGGSKRARAYYDAAELLSKVPALLRAVTDARAALSKMEGV